MGELAGSVADYGRRSSPGESRRLVRAVFDAVDEIGRVATAEQIDCDYAKGGTVRLARTRPQAERQAAEIGEARSFGLTEDEIRLLDADEAREQLNATEVRSGILLGPSAVVDPAKLALGLACAAEASGVEIYEQTRATRIGGGAVQIAAEGARGSPVGRGRCEVRAPVIVRATEAYTRDLRGQRRDILPVYSRMIATEPLPDEIFDDIGLASRPSFADDRRMVTYGQRTADNRIAFGATGVPYSFGSRIVPAAETHSGMHHRIWRVLAHMLPQVADARITHRWGGVLAFPATGCPASASDLAPVKAPGRLRGRGVAASNARPSHHGRADCERDTAPSLPVWG